MNQNQIHRVSCKYCYGGPFHGIHGLKTHIGKSPPCKLKHDREASGAPDEPDGDGDLQMDDPHQGLSQEPDNGGMRLSEGLGAGETGQTDNGGDGGPADVPSYYYNYVEGAAATYGHGTTRFEEMKAAEDANPADRHCGWRSQDEFELVQWLCSEGISKAGIDRFIKLSWVCPIPCFRDKC